MATNFLDKHFGRFGNRMFQLAYLYAQYRDGKLPDIYLQNLNYFDKYKKELQQLFGEEIVKSDYISIHVRRGKNPSNPTEPHYSDNPFYAHLDLDYYQKAMEQFPNEKFIIFTDDLDWCWQQDYFRGIEKVNGDELEDWNRIAGCKGHIIANSSYSWWAAYIGGGKTIAPKEWFANGTRINYPREWIVV